MEFFAFEVRGLVLQWCILYVQYQIHLISNVSDICNIINEKLLVYIYNNYVIQLFYYSTFEPCIYL
jgi:hypothetical protein